MSPQERVVQERVAIVPKVASTCRLKGKIIAILRVLLLEDSPLDADLILDRLDSEGLNCAAIRVQTRDEYTCALQNSLVETPFDCILADYTLPGFDGLHALELARAMCPHLPFIFVSGQLGEELAIDTLQRGATDYVLKNRLARLVPAIKRALREARIRSERARIEATLQVLSQASLVLSSLDYATTLAHVARLAVPHFADYCMVDVLNENDALERVAVAHARPECEALAQQLMNFDPLPHSEHPIWDVMDSGTSYLLPEVTEHTIESGLHNASHAEILQQLGFHSCMLVPLLAEGHTLGVMTFVSASPTRRYQKLDVSLAEDLARRCAMAVENARLHRKTLETLRARDEFLAILSHELRSPLTSMLGWIHLLQDEDLDAETRRQGLQVIERNTKIQAQLIEDLLEVSRIITGRMNLKMAPVDIADIVQIVLSSLLPASRAKNVEMKVTVSTASTVVQGDAARLQQVVWNLLSNAIKFTPSEGHIDIALHDDGDFLRLEVRDSGQGITPDFLPFVFDRFRQADSSSTRQHGGLGLGLSIVSHITEMHGGTVQAHSEGEGCGATLSVRLPRSHRLTDDN